MLCFRCGSYNPDDGVNCTVCGQDLSDKQGGGKSTANRRPTTGVQQALIFAPGEIIAGRYKIVDLIGQGGVGAVYKARDTEVDVDVALKGISPNLLQTDEEQKQFQKAIKAARKLQHPNIVRIYDEGQHLTPNRRFFTMKLLEGLTLRKIIRLRHDKAQAFSPEELIPIFQQLGAALDYAHKQTWHGDLKPENVVVLPDLLKVTDFSLVKGLPLKPFLGIAKSRSKGFPYIAPELRVEAQSIDGRVDIYSLGVILAEMLTGLVYEGHFSRAFTAALEQLPTRIDGLIRRALAEHPDGRFAKAGEMAKEVEQALNALGGTPLPIPSVVGEPARPLLGGKAALPAKPATSNPPAAPSSTAPTAPPKPRSLPPPVPANETNPALSISLPVSQPEDDPSLMEIGQSQVLLLESKVIDANRAADEARIVRDEQARKASIASSTDGDIASDGDADSDPGSRSASDNLIARRLMGISGANPDDTVDDPTLRGGLSGVDDIDTSPGGKPVKGSGSGKHKKNKGKGNKNQRGNTPGHRPGLISSGERPPRADELLESLYSDEGDDKLIPPPLPDDVDGDGPLGHGKFPPAGDEESPTAENRLIGGTRQDAGRAPVPQASSEPGSDPATSPSMPAHRRPAAGRDRSLDATAELNVRSAADDLGLTSDEVPSSESIDSSLSITSDVPRPRTENGLAIHDALTALKLHPRPDLVEDPELREALTRTAGTGVGGTGDPDGRRDRLSGRHNDRRNDERDDQRDDQRDGRSHDRRDEEGPPSLPAAVDDDDDSLRETLTGGLGGGLSGGLGGGLRSLGGDEIDVQPPPLVAPLRPVSPPRRAERRAGPGPVAIAAGVGVVVLLVLLGVRQIMKQGGDDEDGAVVTLHPADPDPPKLNPPVVIPVIPVAPVVVDAGVAMVAAVVDAGSAVAVVAPPPDRAAEAALVREREEAERRAADEMARREREAMLTKVDPPKADPPKVDPPKVDPLKVDPPKVDDKAAAAALALNAGSCPKGMVKIDAGSFTFGSSGSDPMRNFGEADANAVDTKAYCIDYYEAPNGKDALPTTGVSWAAAKNSCDRSGKRLCSEIEWERACKGPSSSRFPYGNTYDADTCNTEDGDGKPRPLAAPVDFKKCRSGFKVFMMAGNVEEWVADTVGGQKIAKGGSADRPDFASRCSARHALGAKSSSSTLGYRCCADPR